MACYGVEARTHHDESAPEFIVSLDPADPIFYSTCYVRERAVEFDPPYGSSSSLAGELEDDAPPTTLPISFHAFFLFSPHSFAYLLLGAITTPVLTPRCVTRCTITITHPCAHMIVLYNTTTFSF